MNKSHATKDLRRAQLDRIFATPVTMANIPQFKRGYIYEIRDSLGMTATQMAKWLRVSQPALVNLEKRECTGSISMKSLQRAADALGCKLVYALVPKTSLQSFVVSRARQTAQKIVEHIDQSMALESQKTSAKELQRQVTALASELEKDMDKRIWEGSD